MVSRKHDQVLASVALLGAITTVWKFSMHCAVAAGSVLGAAAAVLAYAGSVIWLGAGALNMT